MDDKGNSRMDEQVHPRKRFFSRWLRTTLSPPALDLVTASLLAVLLVLAVVSFVVVPGSSAVRFALVAVALVLAGVTVGSRSARRRELRETNIQVQELERRLEETEELVLIDSLTGLGNPRHLRNDLPRKLAQANMHDTPVSILLVDVDGLKQVNDKFGHQAGNSLLQQLAALLQESLRSSDVLGRWGGDEFMALLPETNRADALALAKRVQFHLGQDRLRVSGQVIPISISMGISCFPEDGQLAQELFNNADTALYVAKRLGGDGISVYTGPIAGKPRRLGDHLMELGICTVEQVEEALDYCAQSASRGEYLHIGEALVRLGYAREEEIERTLSLQGPSL